MMNKLENSIELQPCHIILQNRDGYIIKYFSLFQTEKAYYLVYLSLNTSSR